MQLFENKAKTIKHFRTHYCQLLHCISCGSPFPAKICFFLFFCHKVHFKPILFISITLFSLLLNQSIYLWISMKHAITPLLWFCISNTTSSIIHNAGLHKNIWIAPFLFSGTGEPRGNHRRMEEGKRNLAQDTQRWLQISSSSSSGNPSMISSPNLTSMHSWTTKIFHLSLFLNGWYLISSIFTSPSWLMSVFPVSSIICLKLWPVTLLMSYLIVLSKSLLTSLVDLLIYLMKFRNLLISILSTCVLSETGSMSHRCVA